MSDYPMLISNKLHSFRNFDAQSYNAPVSHPFHIHYNPVTDVLPNYSGTNLHKIIGSFHTLHMTRIFAR